MTIRRYPDPPLNPTNNNYGNRDRVPSGALTDSVDCHRFLSVGLMKKKRIKESTCAVEIDAEQMEYLRYYNKQTGQPITNIVRDMIAQWVAVEYATRIPMFDHQDKGTKRHGKVRKATKKF